MSALSRLGGRVDGTRTKLDEPEVSAFDAPQLAPSCTNDHDMKHLLEMSFGKSLSNSKEIPR